MSVTTLAVSLAAVTLAATAARSTLPTPAQAAWQEAEIMALVHFNMGTFVDGGSGCYDHAVWPSARHASTFAPSALNCSQWADSMLALGVTEAVLTAKHGCGFYTWATNVSLPDGTRYPYAVNASFDVLRQFTDAMDARGIGHGAGARAGRTSGVLRAPYDALPAAPLRCSGLPCLPPGFYYSMTQNYFLNLFDKQVQPPSTLQPGQVRVTQAEYEAIALASLTELWTAFGNLTEIWCAPAAS